MSAAISIALRAIASASMLGVEQRAGGGERVVAARADADDAVLGLEHVAGAGEDQASSLSATIIIASSRRR